MRFVLLTTILMASLWSSVSGHGRLWTPPCRGTMWRKGYHTPKNYNDNELYCGGFMHQVRNGYKCGICGDPFDGSRPHEAGGKYAKGIITANYTQGEKVTLQVQITTNHLGWFEFKLCPNNDVTKRATQECLDQYPLELADGSGTKLPVGKYGSNMVDITVRLPKDLTCEQCVLQWHYHTGNSWGTDKHGKGCKGCGLQEEFYGCADVRISPSASSGKHHPHASQPLTQSPKGTSSEGTEASEVTTTTTTTTSAPAKPKYAAKDGHNCRAVLHVKNLNSWCEINCAAGFCPRTHCKCD